MKAARNAARHLDQPSSGLSDKDKQLAQLAKTKWLMTRGISKVSTIVRLTVGVFRSHVLVLPTHF